MGKRFKRNVNSRGKTPCNCRKESTITYARSRRSWGRGFSAPTLRSTQSRIQLPRYLGNCWEVPSPQDARDHGCGQALGRGPRRGGDRGVWDRKDADLARSGARSHQAQTLVETNRLRRETHCTRDFAYVNSSSHRALG